MTVSLFQFFFCFFGKFEKRRRKVLFEERVLHLGFVIHSAATFEKKEILLIKVFSPHFLRSRDSTTFRAGFFSSSRTGLLFVDI